MTDEDDDLRVVVIEVDDVVERRDPKLPNVWVGVTTRPAEEHAAGLQAGRFKPAGARGRVVPPRLDLAAATPLPAEAAREQEKDIVKELRRQGYTVNRNQQVWRTYVIRLADDAVDDAGAGYVYVGETSRTVEDRLDQHLTGARNSRGKLFSPVVRDHGIGLAPELMTSKVYMSKKQAQKAERRLAERLRKQGFVVEGGH